jgi:hypothetical protein
MVFSLPGMVHVSCSSLIEALTFTQLSIPVSISVPSSIRRLSTKPMMRPMVPQNGGGGAFWQGGAAPAVDASGNIYLNSADGSFNADQGGNNYGDTLLKLQLNGSSFQVVDWLTPYDEACIDLDDLELGSAGIALLPTDSTNGANLAIALSKQGRLFLVNTDNLGKFNAGGDNQIKEEFMVGAYTCSATTTGADADGPNWNRLYGTASYWNGNVYMGASNMALMQYQFQNGLLNSTPVAMSPTTYGYRGPIQLCPRTELRTRLFGSTKKRPPAWGYCTPTMLRRFRPSFGTARGTQRATRWEKASVFLLRWL